MDRDRVALVAGVEAVLFDMDGTLVDSDAAVERAWSTWATEHGVEPAAALAIAHGSPAEATVRALLPALGPVEVAESDARQYDDLVTADDVPGGKPDPEGYLLAARQLGVAPQRCLVVEDPATGLAAGRAAGALTAALKGHDGDLRLARLGELADFLEAGQSDRAS